MDGHAELLLHVPYDSSIGASCWTFGGECETGATSRIELSPRLERGRAARFEVAALMELDTPTPDACVIYVEDGGVTGDVETPRIHVDIVLGEEMDEGCVGIGRKVTCLMPPLEAGEYVVVGPDEHEVALTVE